MKRMNLLPPELRPRDGARRGSSYVVLASLGAAIVAMLAYGFVIRGVHADESELASLNADTDQAQAQVEALAPYAAFTSMKQTREQSVRSVAETRFNYERLARELARILPQGVSVSHLEVAPGGPSESETALGADNPDATGAVGPPVMQVTGCAPDQDAVADTLDRLRALTSATEVKLGSSGSQAGSTSSGGSGDEPYLVSGSGGGGGCGAVSFDATVTMS